MNKVYECPLRERNHFKVYTPNRIEYNSHVIQFIYLNYTIQCFLVYSQDCVTIITI